ncbi:MAG: TetR/AcrR family transcriptional regulator [Chloroflexi bacterium]|nr:MAG: TetR/AcrR family transcriptional regulator [Chloroflexota bacterium]
MTLTRYEQRKAATRQSLINAARDVIAERGYNHVEILDITERANVSKATFYKHFPNKEACVRDLIEQGFDALVEEVMRTDQQDERLSPAWIESSLEKVFHWAEENREFSLIMVGGGASTELNAFGRNYMAQVVEQTIMAEEAKKEPPVPLLPAQSQAQIVTGITIQLVGWWLENPTEYSAGDMARIVCDVIRNGIAPHLR